MYLYGRLMVTFSKMETCAIASKCLLLLNGNVIKLLKQLINTNLSLSSRHMQQQ